MRVIRLDSLQQFAAVNLNDDPGYVNEVKLIPNCCKVIITWNLTDGKQGHNVLYASWSGSPTLTAALATTVMSTLTTGANWTALSPFIATTTQLASVTLTDIRSITGVSVTSTGAVVPGTATGPALPDEVSAVLTLRTNNRGPQGRGRMFVPGFGNNAVGVGNIIVASCVTALGNWGNGNVVSAVAAVGPLSLGLYHRAGYTSDKTGRVFPERAATTAPVTSVICRDNHWDTQRKRGLR